jgi:hypothetical protein
MCPSASCRSISPGGMPRPSSAILNRAVPSRHPSSVRRFAQGVVHPIKGGRVGGLARFVEVLARREDVVQRPVVQVLGKGPAFSIL